jgi:hypothetical protein
MILGFVCILFTSCGHPSDQGPSFLCNNPAPLSGNFDPAAPGYIVLFNSGIDAQAETTRLSLLYGFQPENIYNAIGGFSASFSDDTLSHLRCEPSVLSISYNGAVWPN